MTDTQSSGEVKASDLGETEKGQAGSLGANSTLIDSDSTSRKV